MSRYQSQLDDEILGKAPVQFVPAVVAIYKKRLQETQNTTHEILSQPFDFTKQETVNLDYEKLDYPASAAAQREEIRKKLKYLTLENMLICWISRKPEKIKPVMLRRPTNNLKKKPVIKR
ncbi:MAG: hypothetical protein WDM78_06585 [Puia sp.]